MQVQTQNFLKTLDVYKNDDGVTFKELKTFGDLLSFMNKRGVKIYVNGTWNVLTSVEKTLKGKVQMPAYVTPLTLKEMAEVFNTANIYMRY